MVIDYQWLISKNKFPKVTILKVTCFWRFFQKSLLSKWLVFKRVTIFKRWLVLKKLPRVTNFNLSHQEIINMWPWHEFNNNLSTSFVTSFFIELSDLFLFIFLKVFIQSFLFQEKFFDKKLVLFFFILFSLCQKNRRTNRLNSFVSLFSLTKDSKD